MPKTTVNPAITILATLDEKGKLTWNELLKTTNLNKGTLSIHLNQLIDAKVVNIEIEQNKARTTFYSLAQIGRDISVAKNLEQHPEKLFTYISYSAIVIGSTTAKLEDREMAKMMFNFYLKDFANNLVNNALNFMLGISKVPSVSSEITRVNKGVNNKREFITELWETYAERFNKTTLLFESLFWFVFRNPDLSFIVNNPALQTFLDEKLNETERDTEKYKKDIERHVKNRK
jgi:DNA-binding MarR family transcriptional regulator